MKTATRAVHSTRRNLFAEVSEGMAALVAARRSKPKVRRRIVEFVERNPRAVKRRTTT